MTVELAKTVDEKWLKKQIFRLIKDAVLYIIKSKLMEEFTRQGLHLKFKKEIETWCIYLDQQRFGKELEKKMLIEIERFMADKRTIEELIEEVFEEPEWVIEIEEGLIEKYPKLRNIKRLVPSYA